MRIFDCSNSDQRPAHRGNGGPLENDVVGYLKRHSARWGAVFVPDLSSADVAFTNDVFTDAVLASGLPRVKRMDGVFWREDLRERNEPLNRAARMADHVVFISEFSRDSYFALYGEPLRCFSVAPNAVDPTVFRRKPSRRPQAARWVAVANDWSRPEKRLGDTLAFAAGVEELWLIGRCPVALPANVRSLGYLERPEDIARALSACDAMVCLSHRDPCPKVVAQAVSVGLPVLYAASGGVGEMVTSGITVTDDVPLRFSTEVPRLDPAALSAAHSAFTADFPWLSDMALAGPIHDFEAMLTGYFDAIRSVVPAPSLLTRPFG